MNRNSMTPLLFALSFVLTLGGAFVSPLSAQGFDAGSGLIYNSAEQIGVAQTILEEIGYLRAGSYEAGTLDGATRVALRSFQHDHGQRPSGRLDWETMSLLPVHAGLPDEDADGVPDGRDNCPGTARGALIDAGGCAIDTDGDRVPDGLDRCAGTLKGARVDASGCPIDSDGDGIFDGLDRCPKTPANALADPSGCPIDSDSDGVFNGLDACPNTPAAKKVDVRGCPEPDAPIVTKKNPLVIEGVRFDTNRATLTRSSYGVLDQVVASLLEWAEIKIEVGGHADATGTETWNRKLSNQRANAVRDYLVAMGVKETRLVATGFGQSMSVADNSTDEGRAQNRRVELKRID